MGLITKVIKDKLSAPVDYLRGYKDRKIPLYQGQASEGKMPENLPEDIEKIKKIKEIADKVGPAIEAITATIAAIKTAKAIAKAAKEAGQIGSALVPPVAAAAVIQEKLIELVKSQISEAKSALKNLDFLRDALKALAIQTIIELLAIKLAALMNGAGGKGGGGAGSGNSGGSSGESDLEATQREMDELLALAEAEGSFGDDDGFGSGVTTITNTTTVEGTTTTVDN